MPRTPAAPPSGARCNVLLARHGQSEWNALGRWQGHADPPLSGLGRAQAAAAANAAGSFDAVFASDLERSFHTAAIISEAIGVGPVVVDPRIKERTAGEYEGLTRSEIDERYPGALDAGVWPPGWEPDTSVLERVWAGLDDMVGYVGGAGTVLAVTHGGVIYTLENHFRGSHDRISNLGGRWLHHDGSAWHLGDRIDLVPDDVAHPVPTEEIL